MSQSLIFETFMDQIWTGEEPNYSQFHDAFQVASAMGARQIGAETLEGWSEWLFPDGSRIWIVSNNGIGSGTTNSLP